MEPNILVKVKIIDCNGSDCFLCIGVMVMVYIAKHVVVIIHLATR